MKYLIDTHVVIWMNDEDEKISHTVKSIISDHKNEIVISMASIWELAIKINIGKLALGRSLEDFILFLKNSGFSFVNVEEQHLIQFIKLPLIHKDPFDRLLIATAISEDMTLITADKNMHQYDFDWAW